MVLLLRTGLLERDNASQDAVVIQMDISDLLVDLCDLLITAAPLGARQVFHFKTEWLSRRSIFLIEERFDRAVC